MTHWAHKSADNGEGALKKWKAKVARSDKPALSRATHYKRTGQSYRFWKPRNSTTTRSTERRIKKMKTKYRSLRLGR